jgi:hypothetical protein
MSNPQVTIGVSAVDNAKSVLQSVDDKIKSTATTIDTAGSKVITKSSQMSALVKQNFTSIAQSAAGLAAGITSFATSFGTLEKAQLSADTAQVTYEKSLQRLEKLQASGKATAEQLATAQLDVANNAEKLRQAQDNVNETYANFLAQVPGQIISFGVAASGIMNLLGISHRNAAGGAIAQTGATNLLNASIFRTIGTAIAARAAMIAAFITTPVGAAIVGVTTLITLLVFNVGGLRDRIFELGGAILKFLDHHFKPLADAIRWFIDNVAKPLGNFFGNVMPPEIDTTTAAIDVLNQSTIELGTNAPVAIANVQSSIVSLEAAGVTSFNNMQAAYEKFKQGIEDTNIKSIFDDDFLEDRTGGKSGGSKNKRVQEAQDEYQKSKKTGKDTARYIDKITKAASGYDGMVFGPSLFLAGESGPEHVRITPQGRGGFGGGRITIEIPLILNGKEFARAVAKDIEPEIGRIRTTRMRLEHEGIYGLG